MELDFRHNTAFEVKFVGESNPGAFTGYGSVFNKQDSHDDIILPGAFAETLAAHKLRGTMPSMHAMHSLYLGGDMLPVGVWKSVEEDSNGLHVAGNLLALDSDTGKRVHALMKEGALPGLSIVYRVGEGDATYKESKEARYGEIRTIHRLKLRGIDVVDDPSNEGARIMEVRSRGGITQELLDELKAMMTQADAKAACGHIQAAADLHQKTTAGGNAPNAEERAQMVKHLNDAHKAASGGKDLPNLTKSRPDTIRAFEHLMREHCLLSNSEARAIAEGGWRKAFPDPRDEGTAAKVAALRELRGALAGFNPS